MNFGKGFPASKSGGYGSKIPATSVATSPFGLPFGGGLGKGFGYPATKSGGYGSKIPVSKAGKAPFGKFI